MEKRKSIDWSRKTIFRICKITDINYILSNQNKVQRDEFWKYIKACDWTLFKPGEKWDYGNTGYFLLGQIIEAVTETSLSQYADEHIFKPLGMNNTFIRDDHTKIINRI
jgi:CubicO group peptidase (beta-lactamase class C family)